MFERKGVQFVLEALKEMDTNFETHILGDGSYLETLKKLARDYKVPAVFHGFVSNESDEFKEFLETAKIFVLPSEMENFPVALLEAMAAGCAIITTRGTGCEEVVGDAALTVPPRDANAIRAALFKLCSNEELCRTLGKQARKRIEDHFSWGKIADQCMALFEKCMKKEVRNGT
jgi:glycosyltransferase involved in cell wall biosynthesis